MSKLTITTRRMENVTILDLAGDLTVGNGTRGLTRKLSRLNLNGDHHVLLNFSRVTAFDESGMNALADCLQNRVRGDNHVKVFGVDQRPGKMFTQLVTLTHLLTFFDVFEDEGSALRSFEGQDADVAARSTIIRNKPGLVAYEIAGEAYDNEGGRPSAVVKL